MAKRLTTEDLPKSMGAFKPVGHVMVALADAETASKMADALKQSGFGQEDIIFFTDAEGVDHMRTMIDDSSSLAGFGYEITLMHRYEKLAHDGHEWLLVYAPSDEQGQIVQKLARQFNAPMAVKYHLLAVEDLV